MYGNRGIHNILNNLQDLERFFTNQTGFTRDFKYISDYKDFFSQNFIQTNKLHRMYWPEADLPIRNISTHLNMLDESIAIASHLNVAILKKFSFSSPHLHATNFFQLQYVYQGHVTLHWNQQTFELSEGDCFFTAPGIPFYFDQSPDGILIHIIVRHKFIAARYLDIFRNNIIALAFFDATLSHKSDAQYILFHCKELDYLNNTILYMFDEYLNGNEHSSDILEQLFLLFCFYLQRYGSNAMESSITFEPQKMYYHTILDYLSRNYATTDLQEVASHMHFSKQYICRIVKNNSDLTFSQLLKQYRIQATQEYLANTNLNLDSIAELTGFSDAAYLSKCFKQETGFTPGQYREKYHLP